MDQIFDLASLTKALVTATVVADLVESGTLNLDDSVRNVLDVPHAITVGHLLHHTAGYPAHNDFYARIAAPWGTPEARSEILGMARSTPLLAEPGARMTYSDIGFLVLLDLVETVSGVPISAQFARFGATGLTWGADPHDTAATEDCPVRKGIVQGRVHDLNCAAMGGVSSHAGLFGSARAVSAWCQRLLDAASRPGDHPTLPGRTLQVMWSTRGLGGRWLGWDGITRGGYTSTGLHFPDESVGHLGYTGTSVWLVPSRNTVVTLLTNRVHPRDDNTGIRALRPALHDAVAQTLGWDP